MKRREAGCRAREPEWYRDHCFHKGAEFRPKAGDSQKGGGREEAFHERPTVSDASVNPSPCAVTGSPNGALSGVGAWACGRQGVVGA